MEIGQISEHTLLFLERKRKVWTWRICWKWLIWFLQKPYSEIWRIILKTKKKFFESRRWFKSIRKNLISRTTVPNQSCYLEKLELEESIHIKWNNCSSIHVPFEPPISITHSFCPLSLLDFLLFLLVTFFLFITISRLVYAGATIYLSQIRKRFRETIDNCKSLMSLVSKQ